LDGCLLDGEFCHQIITGADIACWRTFDSPPITESPLKAVFNTHSWSIRGKSSDLTRFHLWQSNQ